ncbi:hypothetical protein B566_EDAN006449 [Ephemera danica]|nr:hypothetical protein B566_EDAN006449 [Ephemera danica]
MRLLGFCVVAALLVVVVNAKALDVEDGQEETRKIEKHIKPTILESEGIIKEWLDKITKLQQPNDEMSRKSEKPQLPKDEKPSKKGKPERPNDSKPGKQGKPQRPMDTEPGNIAQINDVILGGGTDGTSDIKVETLRDATGLYEVRVVSVGEPKDTYDAKEEASKKVQQDDLTFTGIPIESEGIIGDLFDKISKLQLPNDDMSRKKEKPQRPNKDEKPGKKGKPERPNDSKPGKPLQPPKDEQPGKTPGLNVATLGDVEPLVLQSNDEMTVTLGEGVEDSTGEIKIETLDDLRALYNVSIIQQPAKYWCIKIRIRLFPFSVVITWYPC